VLTLDFDSFGDHVVGVFENT